jgi:hypothetical protein
MSFTYGDIVRVKNQVWYMTYKDGNGYVSTDNEADFAFTPQMAGYCGLEVHIAGVYHRAGREPYYLCGETAQYAWEGWMFEDADDEEEESEPQAVPVVEEVKRVFSRG